MRMPRQVGGEMLRYSNRTDSGATSSMRNAERLVEIQMADISADRTRTAKSDLRIEVSPVHVNLTTVLMNTLANFDDAFLKHSMRGWIGDHESAEVLRILLRLGANV